MAEPIKVLDAEGVKVLFNLLSLQDYPNNDVLMAVINAIDETKADKIFSNTYPVFENVKVYNEQYLTTGNFPILNSHEPRYTITPGEKYIVIWDDVIYDNLIVYQWEDEFWGLGGEWGPDGTYPFSIQNNGYMNPQNSISIECNDEEEHTFSLYRKLNNHPVIETLNIIDYETCIEEDDNYVIHYNNSSVAYYAPELAGIYICQINDNPIQPITTLEGDKLSYYDNDGNIIDFNLWGNSFELNASDFDTAPTVYLGLIKPIPDLYIPDTVARVSDLNIYSTKEDTQEISQNLSSHIADTTAHLTNEERAIWNAKMNGDKIFIGTKAEYNTAYAAGEVPVGALVVLTDVD